MRVTVYYSGGPNQAYDEALDAKLGLGESTDAGTLLMGPLIRDVMWRNVPDDTNRIQLELTAQIICGQDLVKIEYEVVETWWAPGWRDK